MKTRIHGWIAGWALTLAAAVAQTDVKTVVEGALENTFAGHNYSWTGLMDRPGGDTVSVVGKQTAAATLMEINGARGERTVAVVNGQRYVKTTTGWAMMPRRGPDGPDDQSGPADREDRPRRGERSGRGGPPGGRAPLHDPETPLRDAVARVQSWSLQGDQFVGVFNGLPSRGTGAPAKPLTAGNVTTTVTVKVVEGVLSSATVKTTGTFIDRTGSTREIERDASFQFTAVGSTALTLPPELQAKLAKAG